MEVQPDFKELLELFNELKVEYLIVGDMPLPSTVRRALPETLISSSGPAQKMPHAFFKR